MIDIEQGNADSVHNCHKCCAESTYIKAQASRKQSVLIYSEKLELWLEALGQEWGWVGKAKQNKTHFICKGMETFLEQQISPCDFGLSGQESNGVGLQYAWGRGIGLKRGL